MLDQVSNGYRQFQHLRAATPPDFNSLKPHSCKYCKKIVISYSEDDLNIKDELDQGHSLDGRFSRMYEAVIGRWVEVNHARLFNPNFNLSGYLNIGTQTQCELCRALIKDLCSGGGRQITSVVLVKSYHNNSMPDSIRFTSALNVDHNGRGFAKQELEFGLLCSPQDKASKDITAWPINLDPASGRTARQLRQWHKTCLKYHPKCLLTASTGFTPRRLLEIQHTGPRWKLRLVSPQENIGSVGYVAISYCWGGKQPLQTTLDNIHEREKDMPWPILPKSIQDAVKVTSSLQIKYLWVDSLCIIQDDFKNLQLEISMMPQIYSNALLTLSAQRASNANDGFLERSIGDYTDFPSQVYQLPVICKNGSRGSAILFRPNAASLQAGANEPLNTRAWALQERLLSPRILEFGFATTRWVCLESAMPPSIKWRDGWVPVAGDTSGYLDFRKLLHSRMSEAATRKGALSNAEADTADRHVERLTWERVVEEFTTRALTISHDRPLAISGIAQLFGSVLKEQYLVGFWRCWLVPHLSWRIVYKSGAKQGRERRPEIYQGPSWSWMSVNGPVSFSATSTDKTCAKLIRADVSLGDERASFGSVSSGLLTLQTRIVKAFWRCETRLVNANKIRVDHKLRRQDENNLSVDLKGSLFPDTTSDFSSRSPWGEILLVELVAPAADDLWGPTCMVLKPRRPGIYTRVGCFVFQQKMVSAFGYQDIKQKKWFEGALIEEIQIE